ncbi:hypothetical protein SAMN04488005_1961 [Yoonia tamlensis]|uniref:Uncharacterized protein n=1 Tax=Yoonia tamlensis TaxID=390270 RepID=A0A1I6GP09_9RHOB|nr:hypothetical protein SAMN04488005_1961 [Yoonia tamlensis]
MTLPKGFCEGGGVWWFPDDCLQPYPAPREISGACIAKKRPTACCRRGVIPVGFGRTPLADALFGLAIKQHCPLQWEGNADTDASARPVVATFFDDDFCAGI